MDLDTAVSITTLVSFVCGILWWASKRHADAEADKARTQAIQAQSQQSSEVVVERLDRMNAKIDKVTDRVRDIEISLAGVKAEVRRNGNGGGHKG